MQLRIITLIGYTNTYTVKTVMKELKCDEVYISILQLNGILKIHKPHDIITLTTKGSSLYHVFGNILELTST